MNHIVQTDAGDKTDSRFATGGICKLQDVDLKEERFGVLFSFYPPVLSNVDFNMVMDNKLSSSLFV